MERIVRIGSLFFVSFINLGIYAIASVLWRHRLVDLGHGALGWAAALVGWDLAYYWNHRVEHENRVLWACHVNHHSSRLFNLSTALRQPWTPFSGWVFYPGLALLGVAPAMIFEQVISRLLSARTSLSTARWATGLALSGYCISKWISAATCSQTAPFCFSASISADE